MQSTIKDSYEIEVPNDKAATYRMVTFIIALINVAAFAYLYFNETNKSKLSFATLGAILSITALIFYTLKNYTRSQQSFRIEIAFIILALIWFISGEWWLGLPMLLFAVLGFYTNKKTIIRFSTEGINYPSFPPKLLSWADVDFVILKDDVLTIELKNNKLLQFTFSKDGAGRPGEAIFNAYCKSFTSGSTQEATEMPLVINN